MGRTEDQRGLKAGLEELRKSGVPLDHEAAALVGALRQRMELSPESDLAIADLLSRVPTEEAAALLVELESRALGKGDKNTAKAARRALYRLSQRGVEMPKRRLPKDPPVHMGLAPRIEGLMSPLDGAGGRLVWLVRPQPGSLLLLSLAVNEPLGMEDASLVEITRKQMRAMRVDLEEKHGLKMIEADWRYVDALCHQAFERAQSREVKEISSYPALRRRITHLPPTPVGEPLIYQLISRESVAGNEGCLARSGELFQEPEFNRWMLAPEIIESYGDELRQLVDSPLVLSRQQKEERAEEIIMKCLREAFDGPRGQAYVRRLEEMAFHLYQTGRKSMAEAAAAASCALAQSSAGDTPIPFFEQLTRRTLGLLLAEDEKREQEQAASSVLVRPGSPGAPNPGSVLGPGDKIRKA